MSAKKPPPAMALTGMRWCTDTGPSGGDADTERGPRNTGGAPGLEVAAATAALKFAATDPAGCVARLRRELRRTPATAPASLLAPLPAPVPLLLPLLLR